jgi:nucleoid DNA-binding protein
MGTPGCYFGGDMKKLDIARRMARQSRVTRAQAADQLDRTVHEILSNLRQGRQAALPGLGTFTPGDAGTRFRRQATEGNAPPRD